MSLVIQLNRFAAGLAAGVAMLVFASTVSAQNLYGVNPFANDNAAIQNQGLLYLNDTTGAITGGQVVVVSGLTITGLNSLTRDPTTGAIYAIAKAGSGRRLITLNLATGAGVEVGNLGDNFSSLTFRADGQLFGVTGDGATVPETLYLIDKATAAKTIAVALGNGSDGEVIAYNPDGFIYHWSGGGAGVVFERVQSVSPYAVTNIPTTGSGEIFGAVWNPATSQFLVHDISSRMSSWSTTGVQSGIQAATLADVRGLALVPAAVTVPTMTEWMMILFGLALAGGAVVFIQRRRMA